MLYGPMEIADITAGRWHNLPAAGLQFDNIALRPESAVPGGLYWFRAEGPVDAATVRRRVQRARQRGAAAAVVPQGSYASRHFPYLEVAATRPALRALAQAVSARHAARRVLITGSYGKTGFKTQLHHVLQPVMAAHARADSKNREWPVWRDIAAWPATAAVTLSEVAVPAAGIGAARSRLLRPDFAVITGIAPEHMRSHKTLDALIRNKAGVAAALQPGGVCVINADHEHVAPLRAALRQAGAAQILGYGRGADCAGRLCAATFTGDGWQVQAEILGRPLAYRLPLLEAYAPLTSVGVLLQAALLGADPVAGAARLDSYRQFDSSGHWYRVHAAMGDFHVYDQTQRAVLKGFESMFELMARLQPAGRGRKIVVMSELFEIPDNPGIVLDIPHWQGLLARAGIDLLFTTHDFPDHAAILPPGLCWQAHADDAARLVAPVLASIGPDDMIFLRCDLELGLDALARKLLALGEGDNPYHQYY